jgi:hypothetical protein
LLILSEFELQSDLETPPETALAIDLKRSASRLVRGIRDTDEGEGRRFVREDAQKATRTR